MSKIKKKKEIKQANKLAEESLAFYLTASYWYDAAVYLFIIIYELRSQNLKNLTKAE